ncbi:polysaccharide deacetylase family protein [Roseiconus lacunae]|uniref:Polysaccharide deacetylase family protein n=1 Tax=Roseiconus lacunae TaxID=2605694 RepID=A0ABT7PQQ9_9BACT|nr:polysaccharide deacetylase family protein [Roseiconus lacunae]MDM4018838.1 polysaccharide deacetylase family protein [Roseiconus lacunae]
MNRFLLYYHELDTHASPSQLGGPAERGLVVDADRFEQHLDAITASNRKVVSIDDALTTPTPEVDQVVITFDDGFASDYHLAMPRLVKRGMTATSYVIAGKIGVDPNYMNVDQIREMHASGMTIGSHTMSHPWLTLVDSRQVRLELLDSKHLLEDYLGVSIDHFCLPGGHYNERIIDVALEVGYRSIASCEIGPLREEDGKLLPRFEVRRDLSPDALVDTFRESTWTRLRRLEARKAKLRHLLGLRAYSALRSFAHRYVSLVR